MRPDADVELIGNPLCSEVWADAALSPRDRSIATVAALIALHRPEELSFHFLVARRGRDRPRAATRPVLKPDDHDEQGWYPDSLLAFALARSANPRVPGAWRSGSTSQPGGEP